MLEIRTVQCTLYSVECLRVTGAEPHDGCQSHLGPLPPPRPAGGHLLLPAGVHQGEGGETQEEVQRGVPARAK